MGAWGAGGFENDAALDFAAAVGGVSDIASAFSAEPGQAIEADAASVIIAAAECVAAMLGRPSDDLPDDLAEAFDMFKLAILRHKTNGWEDISRDDVLASLDALKSLCTAPSAESAPF